MLPPPITPTPELDSTLATAPRVVGDKLIVVTRKGTVYALSLH